MPRTLIVFAIFLLIGAPLPAQVRLESAFDCSDIGEQDDRETYCEIREETLPGANPLEVDAGRNGGIRVRGWERGDILVRARIVAHGDTEEEARQIAGGVRLETAGGRVRAEGPERSGRASWYVSYEVMAPQNAQLTLETHNGGISVRDLRGSVRFRARNGGIRLGNVGGEFRGETTNGGITVDLSGNSWDGAGLDVETRNGGVRLEVPEHYSAELETGTTNGRISIDFPVTVQGRVGRHLTTTLGSGGPRIRVMTTNGGVQVRRR